MPFARGYIRTETGKRQKLLSHTALLAGRLNAALTNGDMTSLRTSQIRQRNQGGCTGAGFRRGSQLWLASRNLVVPELSDQGFYTLGRLQDWAGMNPDTESALSDTGADPTLVARAAAQVGMLLASEWPGPGDPGHDVANRNVEPPDDLMVPAFDRRGLRVHEVTWQPGQLQATAYALLSSGFPLMGAFCADGIATTDPGAGVVTSLPPASQADHWVTLLNSGMIATGKQFSWGRWDNWWDDELNSDPAEAVAWGDRSSDPHLDGTWRLDWTAAEKGFAFVLALDFLPNLWGVS